MCSDDERPPFSFVTLAGLTPSRVVSKVDVAG